MPLRENGLYQFTDHSDRVYVANWSSAWDAWILKPYLAGMVSPDPGYHVTRQGQIMKASGYPSTWLLADLVYHGQKPP